MSKISLYVLVFESLIYETDYRLIVYKFKIERVLQIRTFVCVKNII